MKQLLTLLLLSAVVLLGADVTGKWKATFTSPDGQTRENTFDLKAEGGKLTGTLISGRGDAPIRDGKIEGDNLSFTVVRNFGGEDITFNYKGSVQGNEMKLRVTAGDRDFEMTAKKM